jgi:hypothetical protein
MTRLWFGLFWSSLCLSCALSAPINPIDLFHRSNDRPSEPVTLSTYGHWAINLGLAAGATLGTMLAAEWVLCIFKSRQEEITKLEHDNFVRDRDLKAEKEKRNREHEALQLLIGIAEKYARVFSSRRFDGKFQRYRIPKEIHQGLESIFKDGSHGTSKVRSWKELKENLKPLLDFE